MKDLEIRGAGNLLGPQQSGHIASVGYDMYCQLLRQAVEAAREIVAAGKPYVVDLDLSKFFGAPGDRQEVSGASPLQ